jgi:DNA-binding response OmpR family regulator
MRILIADDDLTSRTLLASTLKKLGHEPITAKDGLDALRALEQPDAPRLAILDWLMPEFDGPEVCRRVRQGKINHPPYLILLTSRDDKNSVSEGLQAGADEYLAKPFNPIELAARIDVGIRIITLQDGLAHKVSELEEALRQIKTLRGIVPICAGCKKIRDDAGYWNQVEAYVSAHSEASFTHGLCPECVVRLYPELQEEDKNPH